MSGSKKNISHKITSTLYSIINKRKVIIFDAYTNFHLKHFTIIINELIKKNDFDIYVIGEESSHRILPKAVTLISNANKLPLHRKYIAFITTEVGRGVYWLDCPAIYFGHGIGPKLNYAASEMMKNFDYILSSCKPIHDIQKGIIQNKSHLIKVGLPILEEEPKPDLKNQLHLNANKKVILYAPSWCNNIDVISDIDKITQYLQIFSKASDSTIIISPHPLLFIPERCSGKIFFESVEHDKNTYLNKPDSQYSTLDLVHISDVIISDISSILFESMILNKKVIFDGNKEIYSYSDALPWFYALTKVCLTPDWDNLSDKTLQKVFDNDILADKRILFINEYAFNIGHASEAFINFIYKIAHEK